MKATATLTKRSGAPTMQEGLRLLSGQRVLVGIPEDKNSRKPAKGEKNTPINNAALLFILSKGSQKRNLPATPIVEPAILAEDNRNRINGFLKQAAQADLEGRHADALEALQKAGLAGANAAKRWFTDPRNGWPPNADSTINRKLGKLPKAKREAAIDKIVAQKGSTKGVVTRNIDTGQLRRAMTYVVDEQGEVIDDSNPENGESEAEEAGEAVEGAAESAAGAAGEAAEIIAL